MRSRTTVRVIAVGGALLLMATFGACRKKGPMEKAGEKVDSTVEKVGDAINPKGPAEKAGRSIDKAVDDVKE